VTKPPPRPEQLRRARLVQQDICIEREDPADPSSRVVARVHCTRAGCALEVEGCAHCAHFGRIEVHEAGYVLLCQEEDESRRDAPAATVSPEADTWPDLCSQTGDAETSSDHGSRNGNVTGSRGTDS
jgi:hypothetical protein